MNEPVYHFLPQLKHFKFFVTIVQAERQDLIYLLMRELVL